MSARDDLTGKPVEIEEDLDTVAKYDPELRFRRISGVSSRLVFYMTLVLSIFHIYTAGFGVLQEWRHRAFHLAFVLPLVFMFYTIRRKPFEGKKHLIYDVIYSLIATSLIATISREIFELGIPGVIALSAVSFLLILYFKRREFWSQHLALSIDFPVFTAMLVGLGYLFYKGYLLLDLAESFKNLNPTLLFWTIFLFATFGAITLLFVIQWGYAARCVFRKGTFDYLRDNIPYFDVFAAFLSSVVSVYIFLEFNQLVVRSGLPHRSDLLCGGLAMILVLEGARRSVGPALPLISYLVLLNSYLGPYFLDIPGLSFFAHRGYSVSRIIEHMYLGTEGIYGIPLGVVATFVFHFVLFGIFISKSGLGQLFMDLAMSIAGWSVGGPAKVSVISSGFMGSISGSSIANTVTTGAFTIPLMKRIGYPAQFAGAVEAAASTGGQLMPPIMGAAAFVMAEFLGIPYIKIAACAVIPSFLHFFAVGLMVHFQALKLGLVGLPRDQLPRVMKVLRERWLLLLPLLVMVYLLVSGTSPFLAAFWSIIYAVAIGQVHQKTYSYLVPLFLAVPSVLLWLNPLRSGPIWLVLWSAALVIGYWLTLKRSSLKDWLLGLCPTVIMGLLLFLNMEPFLAAFWGLTAVVVIGIFYKESKMRVPAILSTLEWGTKNALAIGAACACVGFIVGATTLTGLGLKFAAMVIDLSSGFSEFLTALDFTHLLVLNDVTLFFTLFFTAISCFVLGMGLPTTAQYIIASMIAAPALLKFGIHPLISHMFVLFYAVLADVTPPVALAAYAASGISGADPFKTGFTAFSLSSAKIYVPFAFTYSPIILWMPKILDPKVSFDFLSFILVFSTIVMGVISLGSTIIGYLKTRSTVPERIASGIAAGCLLFHEPITSYVGFGIMIAIYLIQRRRSHAAEPVSARAAA